MDARTMFQNLILAFKTLLYSLSAFGNTSRMPARPSAQGATPGMIVPTGPSLGLREEELRIAVKLLTSGAPCLLLFYEEGAASATLGRPANGGLPLGSSSTGASGGPTPDIYGAYAEIFTTLQVRRAV